MKKLVTHNGGFHADDIIAYAILQEVLTKRGESWILSRSRDPLIISQGDIVFDVGDVYDDTIGRYDHHQTGRAGERANGVLYASAGLIWKHFGRELCNSDKVYNDIDKFFISPIDAMDNGQDLIKELNFDDVGVGSFCTLLGVFEPTVFQDKSEIALSQCFNEAARIARVFVSKLVHTQNALYEAHKQALDWYEQSTNKQVLVFEKNYERPIWIKLSELPEPLFVIYPEQRSGTWKAETIRKHPVTFEARVPFPASWAGLSAIALADITGVSDAEFCHPGRFLCGAKTLDGVQKLVTLTLLEFNHNKL